MNEKARVPNKQEYQEGNHLSTSQLTNSGIYSRFSFLK